MKKFKFNFDVKKYRYAIIGGIAAAAIVAGGVGYAYVNSHLQQAPVEKTSTEQANVPDVEVNTTTATIKVTGADDVTDKSSPAIIHLKGCCAKTEGIETYHALTADELKNHEAKLELPTGRYDVEFITPINEDGSIYTTGEMHKIVVSNETREEHVAAVAKSEGISTEEADKKVEAESSEFTGGVIEDAFTKVDAKDVTEEQIKETLNKIADAVKLGDETLAGENGQKVIDTSINNAAKSGKVDEKVVEEARDKAQEGAAQNAGANAVDKGKVVANGGSAEDANNTKPATGHWETRTREVTKYKSVPVQKTRTVSYDVPVYRDEVIYENRQTGTKTETYTVYEQQYDYTIYTFAADGHTTTNKADRDAYQDYLLENGLRTNYSSESRYKQVPVQKTREVPVYENVQVGTTKIFDHNETKTKEETYTVYENQPYTTTEEYKVWVND